MLIYIARLYEDYPTARQTVRDLEADGVVSADISIIASNVEAWYSGDGDIAGTDTIRSDQNRASGPGQVEVTGHPDAAAPSARGPSTRKADDAPDQGTDRTEGAILGAAVGGTIGTGLGVLAALGMLAIPGLGPVVGAGWLAAMATGALAGAAAGGIIGALTKAGVSEHDAPVYAEGIRRGGAVVSVRVPETDRTRT